jgi:hypothetical protein
MQRELILLFQIFYFSLLCKLTGKDPQIKRNSKFAASIITFLLKKNFATHTIPPPDKSLVSATIANKLLAQELATFAKEKKKPLSLCDFFTISQFGKHGFHATHTYHGLTNTYLHWPPALLALCKKNNIHHVVDIGCGEGKLGRALLSLAEKENHTITWTGVDILVKQYHTSFAKQLPKVIAHPTLAVFSYSLDSIAPQLFCNTNTKPGPPNAEIVLQIKNDKIQETLTPVPKHAALSSWTLKPFQRIFIPCKALALLKKTLLLLPLGSLIVIIDEFCSLPSSQSNEPLAFFRDLDLYYPPTPSNARLAQEYAQAGNNILYFPFFINTITQLLLDCGYKIIEKDSEAAVANALITGKKQSPTPSVCYAIVAKHITST